MADPVAEFVAQRAEQFTFIRDGSKVHCTLTGQDFPPRLPLLEEYVRSKSFTKAAALQAKKDLSSSSKEKKDNKPEQAPAAHLPKTTNPRKQAMLETLLASATSKASSSTILNSNKLDLSFDYSVYEPHITSHKKNKTKLFCQLTGDILNKIPAEVELHTNGRRFKQAKKEFEDMLQAEVGANGGEGDAAVDVELDSEEEEEEDADMLSEENSSGAGSDEVKDDAEGEEAGSEGEEAEPAAKRRKVAAPGAGGAAPTTTTKSKSKGDKPTASNNAENKGTNKAPKAKLNKKEKRRVEQEKNKQQKTETAEEREARAQKEALEKLQKGTKDESKSTGEKFAEKSCKKKRHVNSKNRRKLKKGDSGSKGPAEQSSGEKKAATAGAGGESESKKKN
mmetsp:Transcript_26625/g.67094  ORF Transcript_26625/g.67094 Transcript_26625/m.67094 type:complete len:393 (+) Transcript_26625:414-1592(+)|eukprot:g18207.t1